MIRDAPHRSLVLERSLDHSCYYFGQIVQVARIHAGEKWNTVTIPRGGSGQLNTSGVYSCSRSVKAIDHGLVIYCALSKPQ